MTPRPLSPEQARALEALIDGATLADVIDTLATIAREKAEHIRQNWQDAATARVWDHAARRIETTYVQVRKLGI